MGNEKKWLALLAMPAFVLPFCLYWFTRSDSLGFADAGELALVTRIAGIAHAPGFPAYVISGFLFSKLTLPITGNHIVSMVLFSSLCNAAATLILFLTLIRLLSSIQTGRESPLAGYLAALGAALSFATGYTVWHWANSVEVYAFHLLAFSLLIYGLISYAFTKRFLWLWVAAIGLGTALANHHLTVIFFLPVIPFFFIHSFLRTPQVTDRKNKSQKGESYFQVMITKPFLLFAGMAAGIMLLFYGWMFFRAGEDMVFKFGQPDNLSRLVYHLSGGAWQKNTLVHVEGLVSLRFPYFSMLVVKQLAFFLPFAIAGFIRMYKIKLKVLATSLALYFLILFFYQLRIDQTADTDAYMLLPFFCFAIPTAIGLHAAMKQWNIVRWLLPVIIIAQIIYFFPLQNKKDYNVSQSLMKQLDECTAAGAVLLISDWTLVSQYNYYRFGEKFRNDLVLLNYDLKFTHWKLLPYNYPELYEYIRPEYDRFVSLLGKTHPHEIYYTGCTLNTPELMQAYLQTIASIRAFCQEKNVALMSDPRAFLFLKQYKAFPETSHMSGMLISDRPTGLGKSFLTLPFPWLHSRKLLSEPAATDKIVDLEAALDFSRNYYRQLNDLEAYRLADSSYHVIKRLQKKLKANMPFVYRQPGR
jgi:hypothetical protein